MDRRQTNPMAGSAAAVHRRGMPGGPRAIGFVAVCTSKHSFSSDVTAFLDLSDRVSMRAAA